MIYDKIEILSLPKSFDLWGMFDYINPVNVEQNPDDVLFDGYPGELDSDDIEDIYAFRYGESATGIHLVWHPMAKTLQVTLPRWAVDGDVDCWAVYLNGILEKHPRCKLVAGDKVLRKIEPDVVNAVKADRFRKLRKKLSEGRPFDMDGLNVICAVDANQSATEEETSRLQRDFAAMQWEKNI